MLISPQNRKSLNTIFQKIKLQDARCESGIDNSCKIEQILAYLEIIHSNLKKYSVNRHLVLVDSGAGNCYLSFLVYYYYAVIEKRNLTIHCVDINNALMEKCHRVSQELGFDHMQFHACDVLDFKLSGDVHMVYSLHACDTATDKTLFLGIQNKARTILSVSCCQHTLRKRIRNQRYSSITKHSVFKDKIAYMVGDSLRALLLEMIGYQTTIFEFVSSRYTDKNVMLRAQKGSRHGVEEKKLEYEKIKNDFQTYVELEAYIGV